MAQTKIEWSEMTWNPVTGCTKVSPGCKHCYAEMMAHRLQKMGQANYRNGFELTLQPHMLDAPLRWKRPRTIFVNSMSDLFHKDVPNEYIAAVFGVMAACPQHTFQVLTKRADRMLDWFDWVAKHGDGYNLARWTESSPLLACAWEAYEAVDAIDRMPSPERFGTTWPLPNVWLGTSVEDQKRADERIPHLLQTPAAVRFLSAEPLLGPIDLTGWGSDAPSSDMSKAPATWPEFEWPEWVPVRQRELIAEFWSESCGRGPREWLRDHVIQRVPTTGARGTWAIEKSGWARVDKMATDGVVGRYLHSWNNIGRIVKDDGATICASGGSGSGWLSRWLTATGEYAPKLHWVIVGGESGPGARPMDPDWVRDIRDQCQRAGVAFFFKQHGGVNKKKAGRELDGRTWDQMPEARP